MRNFVLLCVVGLATFPLRAQAETLISKLPAIGSSVEYEYVGTMSEPNVERSLKGKRILRRIPSNDEQLATLELRIDARLDWEKLKNEYLLVVREIDGRVELVSAAEKRKFESLIGQDRESVLEIPADSPQFVGVRRLFEVDSETEPVTSCEEGNGRRHIRTTFVSNKVQTVFGAGEMRTNTRTESGKDFVRTVASTLSVSR
ncbi:MAG: hypothetical protein Aurels2KO_34560 [Aureliella sp.]